MDDYWTPVMHAEGPPLEALTHRLSECPEEFLLPHSAGASKRESIDVVAIVSDHLRAWGLNPPPPGVGKKLAEGEAKRQENQMRLVAIATWLLADEWFLSRQGLATAGAKLLAGGRMATLADGRKASGLIRLCVRNTM